MTMAELTRGVSKVLIEEDAVVVASAGVALAAGLVAASPMKRGVGMYLGGWLPATRTVCPGPVMSVVAPPCCAGRPARSSTMLVTAWLPSIVWLIVAPPGDCAADLSTRALRPIWSSVPRNRSPT